MSRKASKIVTYKCINLMNKIRSLVHHLMTLTYYYFGHRKYIRQQIAQLLKRKTSDTAFLIATGPSIKRQNLELLEGRDCFTISNAYLHKDISIVNPIVHGFAAYHQPMDRQNYIHWLIHASERLPKSTSIYTATTNRAVITESGIEESKNVIFGLYDSFARYLWPRFYKYLYLPPQSGPLLLLPLIVAMGYKKICLIGCDHTTMRDYGGFITNFYENKCDVRKHATDPSVWPNILSEFKSNLNLFEQYAMYAHWVEVMGVEIINISDDSWLDQFPFSTIEKETRSG